MPARGNILSPSCWSQVGPMWGQFGGVGTRTLANNSMKSASFLEFFSEIESHNNSLRPGSKFISKILDITFGRPCISGLMP